MIKEWAVLERRLESDYGLFNIEKQDVRSPRTGKALKAMSIRIPPWAMMLAVTPGDEAVMVRQFRHGIEKICLELPGGIIDPSDASPLAAAKRELMEETGYRVEGTRDLGECYPLAALLGNQGHFFCGTGAEPVAEPSLDEGEDIEIVKVPLEEIPGLIEGKEISHGMVMLAFFLYWMKTRGT